LDIGADCRPARAGICWYPYLPAILSRTEKPAYHKLPGAQGIKLYNGMERPETATVKTMAEVARHRPTAIVRYLHDLITFSQSICGLAFLFSLFLVKILKKY